ncbi:hypothetical protein CPB83DRAFT_890163 [Crepidotus variabilis]|uniref:Nephrocystin 3-like N-terminal domain-containing protein n=1 Tax=Crepidotus variabilis TaxID=179855 RepID=A0A9P6ERU7_9AGAR|nr:hypothetical protein CPB83DRAFT_890163 [Crepidotus variabilis]
MSNDSETSSQSTTAYSSSSTASSTVRRRPLQDLRKGHNVDNPLVHQTSSLPMPDPTSSYSLFSNIEGAKFQGGTYNMTINDQLKVIDIAIEKLTAKASPHAAHDSLEPTVRPRCHPNTRIPVLQRLEAWQSCMPDADPKTFLLWLKGDEATGKSAIAEICASRGQLLASFSFDSADPTRNHVGTVVASIAHQLSVVLPPTRNTIAQALDELVAQPLLQAVRVSTCPPPHVIILDGLDHCVEQVAQLRLLNAFQFFASSLNEQNIPIRILITSRPTPHLGMGFSQITYGMLSSIALEDYDASADTRHFLQDKLEELRQYHPLRSQIPPSWPEQAVLDQVMSRVNGRFGGASAIVLFVSVFDHDPTTQLQITCAEATRILQAPKYENNHLLTPYHTT